MKILSIIPVSIILITLLLSCKTNNDVKKILSKSDTRQEIMHSIANSGNMSEEMMEAMLNSSNNHSMIMENKARVVKIRRNYPGMKQNLQNNVIEEFKSDQTATVDVNNSYMVN